MAVHSLTVKQILSRVREIFPDAKETYVMEIINDALVEAGGYRTKVEYATTSAIEDQMWYSLKDNHSGIEVVKVFRVDFMDSDGLYKKIGRLLDGEVNQMDLV